MKKLQLKTKISTIALILMLTLSAILVVLPAANAQVGPIELIMNCGTSAITGGKLDVDLNGDTGGQLVGLKFAYIPPGGTEWIITTEPIIDNEPGLPGERYVTDAGGDCDIDWTPTEGGGDYQVKWVHPASGSESQVVTVTFGPAPELDSYPFINAVPNPVQVNKPTLFHVGSIYPTRRGTDQWADLVVEIEDPTGELSTLAPVTTDSTGGTATIFTPTMVGTYNIRTYFPEQVKTFGDGFTGGAGTIMLEGYSEWLPLVVQADPIPFYPTQELPTEYWTRPISGQIREWYTISAPWLQVGEPTSTGPTSMAAPGNEYAPESGHILFRKPLTVGGLAGGTTTGEHGFEQGDAYVGKFNGIVILGGRLFYNQYESQGGNNVEQEVVCVDLHTGEELWRRPLIDPDGTNRRLSFGQQFFWDSYNYHGVFDFLIATSGSSWHFFDTFSGRWVMTYEDVPSGTRFQGPNGEWLIYSISKSQGTISLWNSSRVVSSQGSWNPVGVNRDADPRGVEWTVEVPQMAAATGNVYKVREGVILGADFSRGSFQPDDIHMWAVSVDIFGNAQFLWEKTMAPPTPVIAIEDVSVEEDLFIMSTKETRANYGFRLSTGAQIWGPTPSRHYTDVWGHASGNSWDIILEGHNKVIAGNYGGTVTCYNAQTGVIEWATDLVDPYTEILHNTRWRFRPSFYTNDKLYVENTEHNPRDPQPRGAPILALDIETGDIIWQLPYRQGEWSSTMIIGDSIIVAQNTYDQHIYAIGSGPSKTTVTASPEVSVHGSSVLVNGMVTDVSPGTQEPELALRFPNGVPAVSDASMTNWMTYVYNQFNRPVDTVGVQVLIEAYDPNGNYQNLGTATTDSYGNYGFVFEPEVPGTYWISATFQGSNSYYGSTSTTYLTVDEAPESETPTQVTVTEYPGYEGPTAAQVAQNVLDNLPEDATPAEIAQAVEDQLDLPEPTEPTETPEYSTMDIIIVVLVAIAIVIGLVSLLRKRQ